MMMMIMMDDDDDDDYTGSGCCRRCSCKKVGRFVSIASPQRRINVRTFATAMDITQSVNQYHYCE